MVAIEILKDASRLVEALADGDLAEGGAAEFDAQTTSVVGADHAFRLEVGLVSDEEDGWANAAAAARR